MQEEDNLKGKDLSYRTYGNYFIFKILDSNKSLITLEKQKRELFNNKELSPFDRLYKHAIISQNLMSLKREVVFKVEEIQL